MPGLIRIIILGLVIGFVMKLIKKFQQNRLEQETKNSARSENNMTSKKTIRCDQCGVYIPVDETIRDGENNFCSPEHQEEHKEGIDQ